MCEKQANPVGSGDYLWRLGEMVVELSALAAAMNHPEYCVCNVCCLQHHVDRAHAHAMALSSPLPEPGRN